MAHQLHGGSRSLYHRWRSQDFSEVVAQEHVTRTLRNAVAAGRIVHAYLFCGPRGTGKTSTARILAKAANCLDPQAGEPCNLCFSCTAVNEGRAIDLIEIDAASNRGIDDARELREKIKFSPAEARYKVYIIDEAHMLTSEASNALLKTLEEPPPHAILILATTEAHKILPTISSRCQRFDFRRIPLQAIVAQLEMISNSEGIQVEPGVLDLVARMARGSLRDAEGLLDQLVAYCGEQIDLPSAREVLGLVGEDALPQFAEALRRGDLAEGFRLVDTAAARGADLRHFARELVDYLRALMVVKSGADTSLVREFRGEEVARLRASAQGWGYGQLLAALRVFGDLEGKMRLEPFNQVGLEIALMDVALAVGGGDREVHRATSETAAPPPVREPDAPYVVVAGPVLAEEEGPPASPNGEGTAEAAVLSGSAAEPVPEIAPEAPGLNLGGLKKEWSQLAKALGSSSAAMAMVVPGCQPLEVSGTEVTFGFEKDHWRSRVERLGLRAKLEESLSQHYQTKVTVRFEYGARVKRDAQQREGDAVVETAVRELGFKLLREEPISDA